MHASVRDEEEKGENEIDGESFKASEIDSDSEEGEGRRKMKKKIKSPSSGKGNNKGKSKSTTTHTEAIANSQQPQKSIHFTQQQLLETAKQQEIENEKSLQLLLEQQRENALKRKERFNKKKIKQSGTFIKTVSKIVVVDSAKKQTRHKSNNNTNKSPMIDLPKGAEFIQNTITTYTVS